MASKYGFPAASNISSIPRSQSEVSKALENVNSFTVARVIDVILESTNPQDIGSIKFTDYKNTPQDITSTNTSHYEQKAKPLLSNIKNYPLINELVLILNLPDVGIKADFTSKSLYYLNVLSLWNHPHHNALPFADGNLQPTQKKTYNQAFFGSPKLTTNQPTEITFGKTFFERDTINPLRPFEGDVIYEGRWGNSIRFGSTVADTPNNWSSVGLNGDPILIIRNGQGVDVKNGWDYITEDINTDLSSVYFGSTQKLPLEAASTSYVSYKNNPPTLPSEYTENQIIITSGRLVFNSSVDHILLSSNKSINLNGVESVNIDAPTVTIQSGKLYLGSKNATQPLLLGNSTISTLNYLIKNLSEFLQVCSTLVATAPGTPLVPFNLAASQLSTQLKFIQGNLEKLKSKSNFTI